MALWLPVFLVQPKLPLPGRLLWSGQNFSLGFWRNRMELPFGTHQLWTRINSTLHMPHIVWPAIWSGGCFPTRAGPFQPSSLLPLLLLQCANSWILISLIDSYYSFRNQFRNVTFSVTSYSVFSQTDLFPLLSSCSVAGTIKYVKYPETAKLKPPDQ